MDSGLEKRLHGEIRRSLIAYPGSQRRQNSNFFSKHNKRNRLAHLRGESYRSLISQMTRQIMIRDRKYLS